MKNAISQEDKGDGRQQMRAGKLNSPSKNTCARLARRVLAVDFPIFSNKTGVHFAFSLQKYYSFQYIYNLFHSNSLSSAKVLSHSVALNRH